MVSLVHSTKYWKIIYSTFISKNYNRVKLFKLILWRQNYSLIKTEYIARNILTSLYSNVLHDKYLKSQFCAKKNVAHLVDLTN